MSLTEMRRKKNGQNESAISMTSSSFLLIWYSSLLGFCQSGRLLYSSGSPGRTHTHARTQHTHTHTRTHIYTHHTHTLTQTHIHVHALAQMHRQYAYAHTYTRVN